MARRWFNERVFVLLSSGLAPCSEPATYPWTLYHHDVRSSRPLVRRHRHAAVANPRVLPEFAAISILLVQVLDFYKYSYRKEHGWRGTVSARAARPRSCSSPAAAYLSVRRVLLEVVG
jgi:hypothetical protein